MLLSGVCLCLLRTSGITQEQRGL